MAVLHSHGRAVELMARGAVDATAMITYTVPLSDYTQAIELFKSGVGLKIQIGPTSSG